MSFRAFLALSAALALLSTAGCANNVVVRDGDSGGGAMDAGDPGEDDAGPPSALDAGPTGGPDAGPRSCATGCAALERCVGGLCEPYPPCSGAGACPAGEVCQQRRCLPEDVDLDGDGFPAGEDCDESEASVNPGAAEDCNGVDDDCSGQADEGVGPRACSSACGGGSESCVEGAWTGCTAVVPVDETCDNTDQDCDSRVDEELSRVCSTACGSGTETCSAGSYGGCTAPPVRTETCDNTDQDCDGRVDEGLTRACSTACGSGTETCAAGSYGGCTAPPAPAESCNLLDDDCNGACDDVGGCRAPVHRSLHPSRGEHFYTRSLAEAQCCGFNLEHQDFFWVYAANNANVVPFYRCLLSSGFHFYTRSATCEGSAGSTNESVLGYVATSASCGAIPLYRLVRGNDHFYTTSAAERDSAVSGGYVFENIAAYVWSS